MFQKRRCNENVGAIKNFKIQMVLLRKIWTNQQNYNEV